MYSVAMRFSNVCYPALSDRTLCARGEVQVQAPHLAWPQEFGGFSELNSLGQTRCEIVNSYHCWRLKCQQLYARFEPLLVWNPIFDGYTNSSSYGKYLRLCIPVVPHKAVAEVSKIENIKERLVVVNHRWQSEATDGSKGDWCLLSFSLFFPLSLIIYLPTYLPACLPAYLPPTYLSIYRSIYLSIFLSIYLSISLSLYIYLPLYLSIYLSVYLSIYLSFYLSVCLSVCLCHLSHLSHLSHPSI